MSLARRAALAVVAALVVVGCAPEAVPPVTRRSAEPLNVPTSGAVVYAVKGDWGHASPEQVAVTEAMCDQRKRRHFSAVITTGDNFYQPDGTATPANYVGPEECLISEPGHRWIPSWGNHDIAGRDTEVVLRAPARYYTVIEGDLQLFVLDSNRVGARDQSEWLARELSESNAAWKVVVFHHPPFTVGGHPPDERVRDDWVPLFRRHGVRLVLNGHNHGYERHRVDGIVYVITAGGGAPLYPCVRKEAALVTCQPRHHFLIMEVTKDSIAVDAISEDGETFDSFTID